MEKTTNTGHEGAGNGTAREAGCNNGTAREAFTLLFLVALATATLILAASVLLTGCGGAPFESAPSGGASASTADGTAPTCRAIQVTPGDIASQNCGPLAPLAYNCENGAVPVRAHCHQSVELSQPTDPVRYYLWCCS